MNTKFKVHMARTPKNIEKLMNALREQFPQAIFLMFKSSQEVGTVVIETPSKVFGTQEMVIRYFILGFAAALKK